MVRLSAAVVAAFVASAGIASAATINFNVDTSWTTGQRTFTTGAHSVGVEAFHYSNSSTPTPSGNPSLASWAGVDGGLGICSSSTLCSPDSHQVDGNGSNEMAVLNFGSRVVRLTSVTFARGYSTGQNGGDMFDLFTFGNGVGSASTQQFFDRGINCGSSGCTVNVAPLMAVGSIFGIGAFSDTSAFKIQSVSFEVVPLPAAGWGLIAGLGALAALKRRRKAA